MAGSSLFERESAGYGFARINHQTQAQRQLSLAPEYRYCGGKVSAIANRDFVLGEAANMTGTSSPLLRKVQPVSFDLVGPGRGSALRKKSVLLATATSTVSQPSHIVRAGATSWSFAFALASFTTVGSGEESSAGVVLAAIGADSTSALSGSDGTSFPSCSPLILCRISRACSAAGDFRSSSRNFSNS